MQLGVFSPVNRLHAGLNPFNTREPWRFSGAAEQVMKRFLRLRHQLVPYLATMSVRAHLDGEPLVQPMYYDHPDEPAAYACRNQFMFGSELLVAPITSPADRSTGLGRVRAWLPPGDWVDVFTGQRYVGGRSVYVVVAQSQAGGGRVQSRLFYFTEADGRIYSVSTNSSADEAERLAAESEKVINSLQRKPRPTQQAAREE